MNFRSNISKNCNLLSISNPISGTISEFPRRFKLANICPMIFNFILFFEIDYKKKEMMFEITKRERDKLKWRKEVKNKEGR